MCNQYALLTPPLELIETFELADLGLRFEGGAIPNLQPLERIRPTDPAPVAVASGEGAELRRMRWGFAPSQPKAGPVINFRSEGRRFGAGRALAPATAFFEFTGTRSPKTRWTFTKAGEPTFALAALVRGTGEAARFTLLTTEPGPDVAPYHSRQMCVLHRADWRRWLFGPEPEALLTPLPAGALEVVQG